MNWKLKILGVTKTWDWQDFSFYKNWRMSKLSIKNRVNKSKYDYSRIFVDKLKIDEKKSPPFKSMTCIVDPMRKIKCVQQNITIIWVELICI